MSGKTIPKNCDGCPVVNDCPCDHKADYKCMWRETFKETGLWSVVWRGEER